MKPKRKSQQLSPFRFAAMKNFLPTPENSSNVENEELTKRRWLSLNFVLRTKTVAHKKC